MKLLQTSLIALAVALLTNTAAVAGGDVAAGKTKSAACAACHGADGNSSDPQYPRLAGQHANYLVQALKDYQSGARKNPIMSGFAAPLSEQDQEDIAAYFSAQQGVFTVSAPSQVQR